MEGLWLGNGIDEPNYAAKKGLQIQSSVWEFVMAEM